MAANSNIEWTEASWPVVVGCEHVSDGCDRCYAATLTSGRLRNLPEYAGLAEKGRFTGEVRVLPERLTWPLRWRKPRRIFVCSMSDLFHKDVPDEFIARTFAVMAIAERHTFQILTKRHARMRSLLNSDAFHDLVLKHAPLLASEHGLNSTWAGRMVDPRNGPLRNVHLGVSVEDQKWADIRIPALLETPAAVRWLSCEPLLGPVDISRYLLLTGGSTAGPFYDYAGRRRGGGGVGGQAITSVPSGDLSWVVVGGESGRGARPLELDWLRSLRDQCQQAGVAFFVKQLGSRWGKGHHDIDQFPEDLRIREYPEVAR